MKIDSPYEARDLVVAIELAEYDHYTEEFAREIYCSPDSPLYENDEAYVVSHDPWHEGSPCYLIDKATGEWRYLRAADWRPHGLMESFHPVDV